MIIGAIIFVSVLATSISSYYLYKVNEKIKENEIDLITYINTNKNKLI
jgi:hypothetical protein